MRRFGRLTGLGLFLLLGCGGAKPVPPGPAPAGDVLAKGPVEKADLSPVAAPPELFLMGRLKRPGPIVDQLAKWSGFPGNLRALLGEELRGLDTVLAWDAPIEVLAAVPAGGRKKGVRVVASFGVSSLGGFVSVARERGFAPERVLPEVFAFSGPNGSSCWVGPSLGSTSARLVCGDRSAEVEELFAYATRGLPNEPLGNRDLEVELRAEPLRQRFASEIAGTRLFAGFLLRQLETDHPRLDRALSDAAYAVADELVHEVEDTDSIRLGGVLDEAKQTVSLDMAWRFRSSRSWLGGYTTELSRRPGPPPPALGRLPGDASSAAYMVDFGSERLTPVRMAFVELVDAYLDSENVGKNVREHARLLATTAFRFSAPAVQGRGSLPAGVGAAVAEKKLGWRIFRVELPPAEVERALAALHALADDREIWKRLAKSFNLDAKARPKSELGPLTGKGIPAGARSLVVTIPPSLTEHVQKRAGRRFEVESKEPVRMVVVVAPDGPNASVIVSSSDKKDAAARLQAFFASGGKRLGERAELQPLRAMNALSGGFFTVPALLDATAKTGAGVSGAPLPSQGEAPMFATFTATAGPPLTLSTTVTIPAAAVADLSVAAKRLGPF